MKLFPYQVDALEAIHNFNGRALLALDMGLGKTIVALAAVEHYRQWPVVVISPACMTHQWKKEALAFTSLSAEDIYVVEGKEIPCNAQMYVLSYERATRKCLDVAMLNPGMVVLDESHYIKNRKAKRTKQLVPLCRQAPRVLLLTGTPVLNRPEELWSQLQALGVSFGSYHEFGMKYCAASMRNVGRGRLVWDYSGASRTKELNSLLRSSCMIRKTKAEIADQLPEKRRAKIVIEGLARPACLEAVESLIETALREEGSAAKAWARITHSSSNMAANMFTAYKETAELKAPASAQIVAELASGGPLVVFAHHKVTVDMIVARLIAAGISSVRITGAESPAQKQHAVESFQAGVAMVAVCSLKAASTGITLTAASDMVIAEMPFSPGDALQAENRIHRIGQKCGVLIRYLVAQETLDEVLWRMIARKDSLVGSLIDGSSGSQFSGLQEEHVGGYWDAVRMIFEECIRKNQNEKR